MRKLEISNQKMYVLLLSAFTPLHKLDGAWIKDGRKVIR